MLPVSAMHTPRLQLDPSRPYKPIFLLTLEIKTSNKGQISVKELLQMIDSHCRDPRVKKLGRIIAATSVQKRCQLHSWLASTYIQTVWRHTVAMELL